MSLPVIQWGMFKETIKLIEEEIQRLEHEWDSLDSVGTQTDRQQKITDKLVSLRLELDNLRNIEAELQVARTPKRQKFDWFWRRFR
jgi:hypothetical protein